MKEKKQKDKKNSSEDQEETKKRPKMVNLEDIDPEELKNMLDMLTEGNSNKAGNKIKIIGLSNKVFRNPILDILYYLVVNLILIIAADGFFTIFIYKNILALVTFIIIFTLIEYGLKSLIFSKKPGLYIASLGLISLLASAIAALLPLYILSLIVNFGINYMAGFVIVMLGILLVRSFVTYYLKSKMMKNITIK